MRRPLYSEERSGLKKGTWTAEEDSKLIAYVTRYGCWNWRQLPRFAGLARCGKSCRLRWLNYLRPDIKRGNFTPQEDETIINLHRQLGNRWSVIAGKLPGRTDNEIKNHWHTNLKNKRKFDEIEEENESGGAITKNESHETMLRPITSKVEFEYSECDKAIVDNGKSSPEWTFSSESVNSNNNLDVFAFLNAYREPDPIMNASFWAQPCMVDSDDIFIQSQHFSPSSNNINPQLWTLSNYYDEYSLF